MRPQSLAEHRSCMLADEVRELKGLPLSCLAFAGLGGAFSLGGGCSASPAGSSTRSRAEIASAMPARSFTNSSCRLLIHVVITCVCIHNICIYIYIHTHTHLIRVYILTSQRNLNSNTPEPTWTSLCLVGGPATTSWSHRHCTGHWRKGRFEASG